MTKYMKIQKKIPTTKTTQNASKYKWKILMQSYPARALDRRLQEDWARDAREGPRVLMSLRVDFGPMG